MAVTAYALDVLNSNVLSRSARTLYNTARVLAAYRFTYPSTLEELNELHQWAANVVLDTCLTNEGLYIKLGQGIQSFNHVLPPEYIDTLKVLLDRAPQVPVYLIKRVIEEDLGKKVEDIFESFDEVPVASASIAQVHKAVRIEADGSKTLVAVKVQKPRIRKQVFWDLLCHRICCYAIQYMSGIPAGWASDCIEDDLRAEIDFTKEANNCQRIQAAFRGRQDLLVPRVHGDLLSKRVLISDWVDATKLMDVPTVKARFAVKDALQTIMECFGDMIFSHGFVHCDPHPANLLVRESPYKKGGYQIVLVDHGLCIDESPSFRYQYAKLFKGIFTHDAPLIHEVVSSWGIGDPDLFASLLLQKPYATNSRVPVSRAKPTPADVARFERQLVESARNLLVKQKLVPKELVLVGRCMNLLRALNRSYGSPVNRTNVFATRAMRALATMEAQGGQLAGASVRTCPAHGVAVGCGAS